MSVKNLFFDLVKIDSESHHEEKISNWIGEFLRKRNIKFSIDKRHQILFKIEGNGNGSEAPILFCAHMDTVTPGKNIQPKLHPNGKITSHGDTILGGDNKASLASMLFLVDQIYQKKIQNFHTLEFLFTVCEEVEQPGIKDFDLPKIKSKVGFIFDKANEPKMNVVVTDGSFLYEPVITFLGKGAHASAPELAKNALKMMQAFLEKIPLGRVNADSTLNFGLCEVGEATNTVPARAIMRGEFRAKTKEQTQAIQMILEKARTDILEHKEFSNCKISIEISEYCRGFSLKQDSKNLKRLEAVYQKCGFTELQKIKTQSCSDGNHLNNFSNIETFTLNDGCFEVHTTEEWTTVQNLEKMTQIMQKIAEEF